MCNIAGYVGSKNAAPILLEMIKKQQYFDGGLSTGIATIHEGKLYSAKVLGNADDLIKNTDALNFPGTIGIIHSRPDDNFIEHAHPYVSADEKMAVVANGNGCTDDYIKEKRKEMITLLLDNGAVFETAKELKASTYPQLPDGRFVAFIEGFAKYVEYLMNTGCTDYCKAMSDASGVLFSDVVNVMITANSSENIYVSRISRPMNIMKTDDACYISTSQLAFPKEENIQYIKSLPQMKTCAVSKDGFEVSDYEITGGNVIDFTPEEYKQIEDDIRQKLTEKPTPLAHLGGGIMVANASPDRFRPNVKAVYDALWQFEKEGVLKQFIGDISLPWLPEGKIVKTTYFYI